MRLPRDFDPGHAVDEPACDIEAEGVFHFGAGNAGDLDGFENVHIGTGFA